MGAPSMNDEVLGQGADQLPDTETLHGLAGADMDGIGHNLTLQPQSTNNGQSVAFGVAFGVIAYNTTLSHGVYSPSCLRPSSLLLRMNETSFFLYPISFVVCL